MNILSLIYSIPPIPQSPGSIYASAMIVSTDSTRAPSPASNTVSDSEQIQYTAPYSPRRLPDGPRQTVVNGTNGAVLDDRNGIEALFMEPLTGAGPYAAPVSRITSSASHPYISASPFGDTPPETHATIPSPIPTVHRTHALPSTSALFLRRARASSALPPPPPPPLSSLPPAPTSEETPAESSPPKVLASGRPRGNSVGHKRANSGSKLEALEEEVERHDDRPIPHHQSRPYEADLQGPDLRSLVPETPRNWKRDEPLPPLPSPSSSCSSTHSAVSVGTPRHAVLMENVSSNAATSNFLTPRSRGGSTLSIRSDAWPPPNQQQLINPSTAMGTIYQRRSKASAPPANPIPSSPMDHSPPASSRLTASSLPASNATSLGIGRARASSQPGRRPSLVGRVESSDFTRPPIPMQNGTGVPRKASFPSKLNPNVQPHPNLVIQTDLPISLMPPSAAPLQASVLFPGHLPMTPTSRAASSPALTTSFSTFF